MRVRANRRGRRDRRCATCAAPVPRAARFCPRCGDILAARAAPHSAPANRGGRRPRPPIRIVLALATAGVVLGISVGQLAPLDPSEQRPPSPTEDAEVALPDPDELTAREGAPNDGVDDDRTGTDDTDDRVQAPACFAVDGEPCGPALLPADAAVDAIRAPFGTVVVGQDLRVRRIQISAAGTVQRWRTDLDALAGADPGPHDTSVRLDRGGTTLFVSTTTHLHALDAATGQPRWVRRLRTDRADVAPWRAWRAGEHVIAVQGEAIVALDGEDGRLRWSLLRPHRGIQPHRDGVAVLAGDELRFYGPDAVEPRWSVPAPPRAQLRGPPRGGAPGPVVVTGDPTLLLDARDGTVLADLGPNAIATRTSSGQVVAAVWPPEDAASTLVGFNAAGDERWREPGPPGACCTPTLRTLDDGTVVMIRPGGPGQETGWVLSPTNGEVLQRLVRPAHTARIPVAVTDRSAVWLDGTAYLAASPSGALQWRAESQADLLSARPLLLATRDGLLQPSATGPD